jgi:hypothetical protein
MGWQQGDPQLNRAVNEELRKSPSGCRNYLMIVIGIVIFIALGVVLANL